MPKNRAAGAVTDATQAAGAVSEPLQQVLYAPITRIDAANWEVEGVMTSEAIDTFGTVFDYDAAKRAYDRWIGNIREQHDVHKAVGKRVTAGFDDVNRAVTLRARVSKGAPDTWAKVQDGTLSGFSIAASPKASEYRMVNGRQVKVYTDYDYAEVSLVDAPSNPDAYKSGLVIVRMAGGDGQMYLGPEMADVPDADQERYTNNNTGAYDNHVTGGSTNALAAAGDAGYPGGPRPFDPANPPVAEPVSALESPKEPVSALDTSGQDTLGAGGGKGEDDEEDDEEGEGDDLGDYESPDGAGSGQSKPEVRAPGAPDDPKTTASYPAPGPSNVPGMPELEPYTIGIAADKRAAGDPPGQQVPGMAAAVASLPGVMSADAVAQARRTMAASHTLGGTAMGTPYGAGPMQVPQVARVPQVAVQPSGELVHRSSLAGQALGNPMNVQLAPLTDADFAGGQQSAPAAAAATDGQPQQTQLRAQVVQPNPLVEQRRQARAAVRRHSEPLPLDPALVARAEEGDVNAQKQVEAIMAAQAEDRVQDPAAAPAAPATPATPAQEPVQARAMGGYADLALAGTVEPTAEGPDNAIAAAMLNDVNEPHVHEHGHAGSYGDMHGGYGEEVHDHQHQHQDGTIHSHPHFHNHDHHDHYGDPAHSHAHKHTHDHEHYYRVDDAGQRVYGFRFGAPDLSKQGATVAPENACVSRAQAATPAAPVVDNTASGANAQPAETPAAPETAVVDSTVPELEAEQLRRAREERAAQTTQTAQAAQAAQEGAEQRAGARLSNSTRTKLHRSIMDLMDTCNCPDCQDACEVYDPDGDGDDDSTPAGDTDHDHAGKGMGRAQSALLRRAVRTQVEAELARSLAPIGQQFRAIAARLAQTQTAVETRASASGAVTAVQAGELTRMQAQVDELRTSLEVATGLLRGIAAAIPQPGGPVLRAVDKQTGASDRIVDGSVAPGGLDPTLYAALRNAASQGKLTEEQQVAAATALIGVQGR